MPKKIDFAIFMQFLAILLEPKLETLQYSLENQVCGEVCINN